MQVRVLNGNDRQKWNDFAASRDGSQILQSYEWGEFKAKCGWEHFILAVEDGGDIKAGMSVLSRKMPLINRPIFYSPRGPIGTFADPDLFNALIDGICVEASLKGAVALKIDPEIDENNNSVIDLIKVSGFAKKKKQVQPRTTYIMDLTKSQDDLLMGFEEKTRYNIRLSEKKGVKVREDSTNAGIETFYKIYQETSKRDVFLIHPRSYYLKLKECLVDRRMANVFIAEYQDKPVASLFAFRFGDRVWYMYGASMNEYRNVMPNHALHWHMIKWAKEKGCRVYDLWGIPSNPNESHPLYGVYRFKKGFNATLKSWIGVYDLPFDRLSYGLFDKGTALYQNMRSLLTKGRISDSLSE